MDIRTALQDLQSRVTSLETSHQLPRLREAHPSRASHAFANGMHIRALALGFRHILFVTCPADYYDRCLEDRRSFLCAPSRQHLCKSVVLSNSAGGFVCCVIAYGRCVDSSALGRLFGSPFRIADDCLGVTGYEPNAVTPIGLKTSMPIVLDQAVARLDPPFFWLGGGQVSLKLQVRVDEFCQVFQPVIANISYI